MDNIDILSEAYEMLRLRGAVYFRAAISGEWAIAVPSEKETARLHLVLQGECYARLSPETEPVRLNEGDMVIVSGGRSHFLADRPGRRPVPLTKVLEQYPLAADGTLRLEGKGAQRVRLLCGGCDFDKSLAHPALATLPDLIVLRGAELGREPWLGGVLRTMAMEADRGGMGMTTVLTRLLEAVFVQAIRIQATSADDPQADYLRALADPKLCLALQKIHASPGKAWTVSQLAAEVGVSRSVLSERFSKILGEPPMVYVRRWRLFNARNLLRSSKMSMTEIAEACGYASVPSFSRRFTTAFGIGPGKYRKCYGS